MVGFWSRLIGGRCRDTSVNFIDAHGYCPGVFLVKQRALLVDVIDALILVWAASSEDEWENRILEIPQSPSLASAVIRAPQPTKPPGAPPTVV